MDGRADTERPLLVPESTVGDLEITTIVTGRWAENCYVTRDAGGNILIIDPGAEEERLIAQIGESPSVSILLTHGHYDHVGAAARLVETYKARCFIGANDSELAKQAPLYAMAFDRAVARAPHHVETFTAGATLALGHQRVRTVACPGHTRGSAAFILGNVVFTGDTLLRKAVGRTDLPGGDAGSLRASVDELLAGLADDIALLPGHGPRWTVGEAKMWWADHRP